MGEKLSGLLGVLLLATLASAVGAAGFDCAKAVKAAEHAICENEDLSAMDTQQSTMYSVLMDTVHPELKDNLRQSQRAFIKRRNGCQLNVPCLQSEYLWRFHELCGIAQLYGRSCADNLEQPH